MASEIEQGIICSESDIAKAVKQIAARIGNDYNCLSQLVLVGVMDGAICILVDLMRELRAQASGEQVQVATARLQSYQDKGPEGVKCIWLPSRDRIEGRDALIVDCLVNTGATCKCLKQELIKLGAKSVRICALLDHSDSRKCDVAVDYFEFTVKHPAVVGYGLDYKGAHRNLPYIRQLRDQDIS